MANYTKINLNKQSDLVLTNAEINNPSGLLRTELDNILFSATTEVNRAKSAESVLQSNIDNLTSNSTDYTDAEVSKEKARAIAAEGSLETKVDADVSTEKARAIAAEGSLETKVDTDVNAEKVRAVAAEGSLETNINTEKSRIDAILSASDADKDSFAEIVTLINEVDTENDNAFGAYVISNNAALSSEKVRAIAAEGSLETELGNEVSSLEGQISQEVSDRESAVQSEKERAVAAEGSLETALSNESSFLQDEISDEVTNRTADVSTEKARAIAAEGSLETALSNESSFLQDEIKDEETRAIAAEGSLETKVNADVSTEKARAIAAEGTLQDNIDSLTSDSTDYTDAEVSKEKARAIDAEGSLETKVNADVSTEKARAIAAEGSLETKVEKDVKGEKDRAVAAEGSLETNINTEKGRIDAILSATTADKDSFAEIVTLINTVDTENDEAFGSYVLSNNAALSTEKARAIAAEGSLETELGNEVSSLEGKISTEVVDRTADVSTEKARAIAAEGSLETKFDGDVSTLKDAIESEESRAIAAEGSLETKVNADVSTEKARAIAAEGSLETKIGKDIQTLKQNVDDSVERVLDLNFKNMFAQKIKGTTEDKRNYTLDVNPLEASLQVFENGLMLEEDDDYKVVIENGKVKTVTFNYEVKSDWKIKFYGVPFNASDVDLIEG